MLRLLAICSLVLGVLPAELPPSCDSPIYCYGSLLDKVQMARLFNDSKTFVDFKMINSQEATLQKFQEFLARNGNNPTKSELRQFVSDNFREGNELEIWTAPDYNPNPKLLQEIPDKRIQVFAKDLVQIWPTLTRKVKSDVINNPQLYSFIPVPNGFVIPGGRFREYYYWDSYWILQGLQLSEMYQTAKGMIDNFLSIVKKYGFIPNGGRVYYLQRSQPPLLTAMAYSYYQATGDKQWLGEVISTLEKELKYWLDKQVVQIGRHQLAHYYAPSKGPRPESYYEDVKTMEFFKDEDRKQEGYVDLKSGAETGWDFSNRWIFDRKGGNDANLTFIKTPRVVAVDLNAFLCGAFSDIADLYLELRNLPKFGEWKYRYYTWKAAIEEVLWNEKDGIWYDYDIELKKHRKYFYPSNVAPLWAKCFDGRKGEHLGRSVVKYLEREKIFSYLGGVPTSLSFTNEQWDLPNAWAPLQDIVVQGLHNSGDRSARKKAEDLAKRWINSNLIAYDKTGDMYEKYDAVVPGQIGGGGEYTVQTGFGWSNGVALQFIDRYYRYKA